MNIYHFSDKDLDIISPSRPRHSYTKDYGIPVSYWYTSAKNQEPYTIPSSYRYTLSILKPKLYDLQKNPFGLDFSDIRRALKIIKGWGYYGIIGDVSTYRIVMLFYPAEFNQKKRVIQRQVK